jgi:folate-binding protein YgfZ
VSDKYIWLTILGPQSQLFLNKFSENEITEDDDAFWIEIENESISAVKNTNFNIPAYNLCLTNKTSEITFPFLITSIHEQNGSLIGDAAFQIKRIKSGMPDWGTEITQDYNPHEARLIKAVSFTKGCYTGQEVIARLDTYDKVQKYLMIIEIFENFEQDPPINVFIDDDLVGNLTSYTYNPITENFIGLGYINKMYTIENDIYVEIATKNKRIPAKLSKPPSAY